jgi:diacylglycerol kinase family enzyme
MGTWERTPPRNRTFGWGEKESKLDYSEKTCVIFNPTAARRRAGKRLDGLRALLGPNVEFRPTARPGHGEEIALTAARDGFGTVMAAGGDGTVHEVANGVLRADRPDVLFAVMPMGSANDYAYSLNLQAKLTPPSDGVLALDVGLVRDERGRERYFVNTLGLGFSGAVALESRRIGWLQGLPLYSLAFIRALLFRYECPQMEIMVDDVNRSGPTLSFTAAIAHREGSFIVAPQAQLDDGLFDYLQVGPLTRMEVMKFMPKLASGGQLPSDHPALWLGRCRSVKLRSESPLVVHLDGEFFSKPEDKVRELNIKLLPKRIRVKVSAEPAVASKS